MTASVTDRRRLLSWCILGVLACAVCAICSYVVWLGDDVDYGFIIHDNIWNSHGAIASVSDFITSQYNHYMHVNGRTVAHVLVQLFCMGPSQMAFAVCNGLVYIAFVLLLCSVSGVGHPLRNPRAILTASSLTVLVFVTKMMPTTQIGFIWMFALNMLWFKMFRSNDLDRGPGVCAWLRFIVTCALGILAGNGQEALTPGIAAALGVWWLSEKGRIGWRRTIAMFCYWAGVLSVCLSPGAMHRAEATIIPLSHSLMYALLSFRALYLCIGVVVWLVATRRDTWGHIYDDNSLLINAAAVLMGMNIAIGIYSNRQLFGVELLALILTLRLLPGHAFSRLWAAVTAIIAIAFMVWQTTLMAHVRRQYLDISEDFANRKNVVYRDRMRAPAPGMFREWRYYEDIVGQYDNDTHHSLQKDLRRRYPGRRSLHVIPPVYAHRHIVRDTVICYAPGHYTVVSRNDSPCVPVIHGHRYNPLRENYTDTVSFLRTVFRSPSWRCTLIVPDDPFAPVDSITFMPRR